MKSWKKVTGLLAVAAFSSVLLAGCGSSDKQSSGDGKEITVSTWDYDTSVEFKALFDAFEKETGIKVKPVNIPAADYDTKITTMLASGDQTDVLTMKNFLGYGTYAARGQLKDLTDHIKTLDTKPAQDSYDMMKVADGKTYAQPFRTDFWVLYYNKKLFKAAGLTPPTTWDEYVQDAKKLTDASKQQYGAYNHIWRSTVQALGAAQSNKTLTDPSYDYLKDYYERVLDLQKNKDILDYGTAKTTKVTYGSQFEGEKAAMMEMGTWYMVAVNNKVQNGETNVDWGIAPLPVNAEGKVVSFGSPTSMAINKNAKNAEAAQKFIDFVSGEKGAKVLASIGSMASYRTDAIDKAILSVKGMPQDETAKKALHPDVIGLEFPAVQNSAAIDKILTEEHDLIMVGDKSVEDGLKDMAKRVKAEG